MGMRLVHPLTKVTFEEREDGLVQVTEPSGATGVFRPDGTYVSGEVRYCDPHMVDWVGGQKPAKPFGRYSPPSE